MENGINVEVDGVPVTVDATACDDIEVLEDLAELSGGNALVLPRLMKRVFGQEQYANIKRTIAADNGGVCRSSDIIPFFFAAFKAAGSAPKN